ncbi:hypothetical protein TRIP_B220018 [uncultured Desulfatiglans sp.]|uniref:Uncharacterized protein n=1 Tax=Uncultured Desulfatiglans sp. TaxID=1748965 RepID=A0A653A406_UNCDX|nr:hypothetical protein TRIP_B220018 [uncultured Desulfatiglans sp.]
MSGACNREAERSISIIIHRSLRYVHTYKESAGLDSRLRLEVEARPGGAPGVPAPAGAG